MSNEGVDAFEWLADLSKRQCFTTCELSHPAKSLDFGNEGFTASLTDWHELLQLTRPDATCGLVYLRGGFPDNPGSLLSRAQRRDDSGSKGTFGTRLLPPEPGFLNDIELGERKAQGWVNFRWPYSQYELVRTDPDTGRITGTGTCETISFVSRGTVFQINRLKWGHGSSISDYDGDAHANRPGSARFRVGGKVRFGCPCSNNNPKVPREDVFTVSSYPGNCLRCISDRYQTRLEIGFTENSVARGLILKKTWDGTVTQKWVDMSSEFRITLPVGEATYLVSTYALRNDAEDDDNDYSAQLPSDLADYLGVKRESVNMTDRLWTALCATNYEAAEAVEFCIIGRCVEQILGVTSIPVRQPPGGPRITETALIGNIMTSQFVDVQSAFFQIRLLAKIHNFIETRKLERDLLQPYRTLDEIRDAYLVRLRGVIRSSLAWLFATDLKPGRLLLAVHSEASSLTAQGERRVLESCMEKREALTWDMSYNRGCYVTMATWYSLKLCPESIVSPQDHSFVNQILFRNLPISFRWGTERANRDKQPTAKGNVLGWLHFSSIMMLHDELGWEENELPEGVSREDLTLEAIQNTQQRFEKYVSRLKTSQADGWSMEHEELDRAMLLAEEMATQLGFDKFEALKRSHGLAISRARQTRRRIRDRRRTTKFNIGPRPWMTARSLSNGPWELLCTNHEGYLRVADDGHVIPARDRLFEFLLSDYSFMASWDRADVGMVGRWWDIQPVAMICSTLLDLKLEGKLQAAPAKKPPPKIAKGEDSFSETSPNLRSAATVTFDAAEFLNAQAAAGNDAHAAQIALMGGLMQQLRQSIEQSGRAQAYEIRQVLSSSLAASGEGMMGLTAGKPFEWVRQKPGPNYYPDWWVQSLEDTPEAFRIITMQQRDVNLRNALKIYLSAQGYSMHNWLGRGGAYSIARVADVIEEEDLRLLDVFDVFQDGDFSFYVKRRRCSPNPLHLITAPSAGPPTVDNTTADTHPRPVSTGGYSGRLVTTPSPLPATPSPTPGHEDPPTREKGEDLTPEPTTFEHVMHTLNDSLVDVGTKHRILFVQKFSPALVGGLIYLWHPDALDTVDDHFGATSRFTESRESSMWVTSITVSHWTIRPAAAYRGDPHKELHRQNGDFPPENIASLATSLDPEDKLRSETHVVQEQSTSLVITGDPSGYLWVCSAFSPVTNSESIGPVIHKHLPKILRKFIHQQASGRCLAFLLLLGHFCERLAGEYGILLKRLDDIMDIGDRTLLEGVADWFTTAAIDKLKKMLWGWEALRVFNDKLSSSLSQIERAMEAMEHIIKQDAAQQHIELIQEYNTIIDEFKKRHGMLVDVHDRTQLKIKQVTGLRDGISTITNVVDTQTALADNKTTIAQGNNVRTLTYITIAYLPLGFVCALYSVQEGTFMKGASNGLFAALIVVFSVGTYLLAFTVDRAMIKLEALEGRVWIPAALRGKGRGLRGWRRKKNKGEGTVEVKGGGGGGGGSRSRSGKGEGRKDVGSDDVEEGIVLEEVRGNGVGSGGDSAGVSLGKGWLSTPPPGRGGG